MRIQRRSDPPQLEARGRGCTAGCCARSHIAARQSDPTLDSAGANADSWHRRTCRSGRKKWSPTASDWTSEMPLQGVTTMSAAAALVPAGMPCSVLDGA
ncbi:hypothetical protein CYMTET_50228, partial [Cymbomonas tetramitiformis]